MAIPISNLADLNAVRSTALHTFAAGTPQEITTAGGVDKNYILIADIDLNGAFEPIGFDALWNSDIYIGIFDGANHKIYNGIMDYPANDGIGLFQWTNGATIKNLRMEEITLNGVEFVGGITSYAENTIIENCSVINTTATITATTTCGGIVGNSIGTGQINRCHFHGTITGDTWIGGLVADSNVAILDCSARGSIVPATTFGVNVGGFIGRNDSGGVITNSYAAVAMGEETFGFHWVSYGTITNCHYDKEVTGSDWGDDIGVISGSTTQEMKTKSTFIGWDFDDVWLMDSGRNDGYPAHWWLFGEGYVNPDKVTGVSLYPTTISIYEGNSFKIEPTVTPYTAVDKRIVWTTSNGSVATVSNYGAYGLVNAVSAGSATIKATTVDGGFEATVTTTVQALPHTHTPPAFTGFSILGPQLQQLYTISSQDVIDPTITRELSGDHSIDFTIPALSGGGHYLKVGRYIQAEGQRYVIDRVTPHRNVENHTLISVHAKHIFFEIEDSIITISEDEGLRGNIVEHLTFAFIGTGVSIQVRGSSGIYGIERYIEYQMGESVLSAVQKIFAKFDCQYTVDNLSIIVLPRENMPYTSTVLQYAVNNITIEKEEDSSEVITVLYATGGSLPYEIVGEGVGIGDGSKTDFSLLTTPIIYDTELIYLDEVMQPSSAYKIDYETGELVFDFPPDNNVVITADYYTDEGATLQTTVYAPSHIRNQYRKDRIAFISFGDIWLWNNFTLVANRYLQRRMYPRVSYSLEVAELKLVPNIGSILPGRSFHIDIGWQVLIIDDQLGIRLYKPVQKYSYNPYYPEQGSTVVVGDKMHTLAFREQREEGELDGVEGWWVYDEVTGEWVFIAKIPKRMRPDDHPDWGKDYTLSLTASHNQTVEARMRWMSNDNRSEISRLTINTVPDTNGWVSIMLNNIRYNTQVLMNDSRVQVATKIYEAHEFPGWDVEHSGWDITFTAIEPGPKEYDAVILPSAAGVEGRFSTHKGILAGKFSDWWRTSIPLSHNFNAGDTVEVTLLLDGGQPWVSFSHWSGEGEGDSPRVFTMDSSKDAIVNFVINIGIEVVTLEETSPLATTVNLNAEVTKIEKHSELQRGFVVGFSPGLTMDTKIGDGEGAHAQSTLTISQGAINTDYIAIIYDSGGEDPEVGIEYIDVTAGDTASEVATKIAAGTYTGWDVFAEANLVVFTADDPIRKTMNMWFTPGGSGVEAAFVHLEGSFPSEVFPGNYDLHLSSTAGGLGLFEAVLNKQTGTYEKLIVEITEGATADGDIYVRLQNDEGGVTSYRVGVYAGDSPIQIANRLENRVEGSQGYGTWNVSRESTVLTWTDSHAEGPKTHDPVFDIEPAGVAAKTEIRKGEIVEDDAIYYYRPYAKVFDKDLGMDIVAYGEEQQFVFESEFDDWRLRVWNADGWRYGYARLTCDGYSGNFSGIRWFGNEDEITLQAYVGNRYEHRWEFDRWVINGESSTTANPYTFNITEHMNIECRFKELPVPYLTIGVSGGKGKATLYKSNASTMTIAGYTWLQVPIAGGYGGAPLPISIPFPDKFAKIVPTGIGVGWFGRGTIQEGWEGDGVDGPPRGDDDNKVWDRYVPMEGSSKTCTLLLLEKGVLRGVISDREPEEADANRTVEDDLWLKFEGEEEEGEGETI